MFDFGPWKVEHEALLDYQCNAGACVDIHNPPWRTKCTCSQDLDLAVDEKDALVDCVFKHARMSFEEQRSLVLEWK